MNALVATVDGVFEVDVEADELVDAAGAFVADSHELDLPFPRVVAAAAGGPNVIAVVDRRPPLMISHDAGRTWHEAGGGLPPGRAIAMTDDDPDRVLYAARNRLFVSEDGGRFWRALAVELPEIERVAWAP